MGLARYIDVFACSYVLDSTSIILSKYVPIYENFIVIEKHLISYLLLIILFYIFSIHLIRLLYYLD